MKNKILIVLFLTCTLNFFGQIKSICSAKMNFIVRDNDTINVNISRHQKFIDNKEVYYVIDKLMNTVNLPMDFIVLEIDNPNEKNAYASQDSETGVRYIEYGNKWLESLDSDERKLESITILAHEIGHHLSAHTLSLNYTKYYDAILNCQIYYDKEKCEKQYKSKYLKYLIKSRQHELEADRFAGFIMFKYGTTLEETQSVYKKLFNNNDDIESTHPKLTKRLIAVKEGYELAKKYRQKKITKIDLQQIKGSAIELKIKNLNVLKKNKLLAKINVYSQYNASSWVAKDSEYQFSYSVLSFLSQYSEVEKYISNNNITGKFGKWHSKNTHYIIENRNEYFSAIKFGMEMSYDDRIKYGPLKITHIKNDILKIFIIDENGLKTVYTSPFIENKISFEEIKSIFIEIYKNGIEKIIEEFNKN